MSKSLDKVTEVLARATDVAAYDFFVHSHARISDNSYFSVIAQTNGEITEEAISESVAKLSGGSARYVPDTLRIIDHERIRLSRFIVAKNTESMPYNEDNTKGMRAITANVLADVSNQIWNVVGEGDARRLVLQGDDNLEELLKARQARRLSATASFVHETPFLNGDYVAYVNTASGKVGYGFGLNVEDKVYVYDRGLGSLVTITPAMVLEAAGGIEGSDPELTFLERGEERANLSDRRAAQIVDFLRKVYKARPDLMARYESLISKAKGRFTAPWVTRPGTDTQIKEAMGK